VDEKSTGLAGFFCCRRTCWLCELKVQYFGDEHDYAALEGKTRCNRITLDEVVDFQKLLDGRVRKLLAAHPKELFEVEESGGVPQTLEYAPAYVPCSGCGEQMLQERAVPFEGRLYCIPCFQLLSGPEKGQSLH
jgi:formylmethanofuran dehydrogenase subunit E